MNTPLKDQTATADLIQDLQGFWRSSENLIDVPKYNQKPPDFMSDVFDNLKHNLSGWTWKQVRDAWMKANMEIAKHPDITKTDPQHRVMSVGFLVAQLPRYAVSDDRALPAPKTEAELELEALKRKWEGMTDDERIQAKIDQIGECPKENLQLMLAGTSSDVFDTMKSRLSHEEVDEFQTDAWNRWASITEMKWKVSVEPFKALCQDRWLESCAHVETKLNVKDPAQKQFVRSEMKRILREEIYRIYFRRQR